ncbi:hypothetical protein Lfu02_74990 [Longispora fulva]|uniref:Uncharacterized protein n=1 Tax=Longispora fulva TaxID=619741 RepID=A0A8J7KDP0_9ACTN|nr:hypothetical protein [Longispora fulva]MBG6134235.1 hypothetical protein [Longispora fulva]GIG63127.1 hypothetical protein Lfu02_74990 [Longispora fulva]
MTTMLDTALSPEVEYRLSLEDTLARCLFDPQYHWHRLNRTSQNARPIFAHERQLLQAVPEGQVDRLNDQAIALLEEFNRSSAAAQLRLALGRPAEPVPGPVIPGPRRPLNLAVAADRAAFLNSEPVRLDQAARLTRAQSPSVLVLGSYHPGPVTYVRQQLESPLNPLTSVEKTLGLRNLERVWIMVELLNRLGSTAFTALGQQQRQFPNPVSRLERLAEEVDRIILILDNGTGVNFELGMICARPQWVAKTVVLHDTTEQLSQMIEIGALHLDNLRVLPFTSVPSFMAALACVTDDDYQWPGPAGALPTYIDRLR